MSEKTTAVISFNRFEYLQHFTNTPSIYHSLNESNSWNSTLQGIHPIKFHQTNLHHSVEHQILFHPVSRQNQNHLFVFILIVFFCLFLLKNIDAHIFKSYIIISISTWLSSKYKFRGDWWCKFTFTTNPENLGLLSLFVFKNMLLLQSVQILRFLTTN